MANILIVSGSYFPYASANAICMKEFEKALVERGDRVVYAIKKHDIDTPEITMEGDIKIYHVGRNVDLFFAECEKIKRMDLPQPIDVLFRSSLIGIKVVSTLYSKLKYGTLRKLAENKYLECYENTISKIVETEGIDTIISVSMPFLSHKAVMRYVEKSEKRDIKWIAYMIDAYSQKYGVNDEEKIKEELEVMRLADKIIFLSVLKESYEKEPFSTYRDKFSFIPLPLLNFKTKKEEKMNIYMDTNKINFVFAGTLYDDTSFLDYFVKFVNNVDSDKFVFHFMGKIYPRNKGLLEELREKCDAEIIIYGVQPFEFAEKSIEQADIVLNFGNLSSNQIPSKIYNYIVKRKAILTFYKIVEDPSLPMLEKYPLALNIRETNKIEKKDVDKFQKFISNMLDKEVSIKELEEIYLGDTAKDVCEKFLKYI